MYSDKDTIIAVATAPGQGGVGIIRISGPDLSEFIQTFFSKVLKPRHAYFLPFLDSKGEMIDEGIALYFKGPHSYTGEDVLELQGHGGSAVLNLLMNQCIEIGKTVAKKNTHFVMRIAQAGEFTQRAFLNGRLDLTQAEAVADLISASSEASAKSAVNSLKGCFSKEIKE
ncbi:MAG: tRNA uridine-5-carboxymethylaminomethyl(34) synthesis GTPase MnmE, partial [Pasteurella sp.]|nr:tRNA uridine-5-carboxymethylaminomethyl(34) synthesis GTPase MnmE [Pasteurella sp.]